MGCFAPRDPPAELTQCPRPLLPAGYPALQVMSVSKERLCAVVDAGMKAVSLDSGPPQLMEAPNVAAGLLAAPGSSSSSGKQGLPSMSFEGVAYENGGALPCPLCTNPCSCKCAPHQGRWGDAVGGAGGKIVAAGRGLGLHVWCAHSAWSATLGVGCAHMPPPPQLLLPSCRTVLHASRRV